MTRLDAATVRPPELSDTTHSLDVVEPSVSPVSSNLGAAGVQTWVDGSLTETPPHEQMSGRHDVAARGPRRRYADIEKPGGNRSLGYRVIKRAIDIAGTIGLLVVLAPLMIGVCVVLVLTTRGRPLFCQTRYGQFGKPFRLFKFRTMVSNAEELNHLVERDGPVFKKRGCHDPRVTRLGAFLRKTSIDELPQLFNVLLGQMSLVGPRPLSCKVETFQPWQLERFTVRPGLTCLWQVKGRSEVAFDDWMRMDLWYVDNQSLLTDALLLLRTPAIVLSCRGAG